MQRKILRTKPSAQSNIVQKDTEKVILRKNMKVVWNNEHFLNLWIKLKKLKHFKKCKQFRETWFFKKNSNIENMNFFWKAEHFSISKTIFVYTDIIEKWEHFLKLPNKTWKLEQVLNLRTFFKLSKKLKQEHFLNLWTILLMEHLLKLPTKFENVNIFLKLVNKFWNGKMLWNS